MKDDIVIVGMARTPCGGMLGALSEVPAPRLGAAAIHAALERAHVEPEAVDETIMGCVLPAGLGQAPARQASLYAGIPMATPCTTVNKMCGSAMKAVMLGMDAIRAGSADIVVAGGMESMSNAPYLVLKGRSGYRLGHGELYDHMFLDGLEDAFDKGRLMGTYAEDCADKYGFTREAQDAYAIESLRRANEAIAEGKFDAEIVPVTVEGRKGDVVVSVDEQPGNARPDKIPQLKPAFRADGTVTPANSSSISDGAAAVVLMTTAEAERRKIKPLARVIAHASYAQQPGWFTTSPVGAIRKVLEAAQWNAR
ncbi:MAG: acetyl-CoA C-acyltransferase, partial [Gammaproteobacteria bacterium]|nr:acetyl-CoA C-acyltransferase [Gammaproteobacteria bacterium]